MASTPPLPLPPRLYAVVVCFDSDSVLRGMLLRSYDWQRGFAAGVLVSVALTAALLLLLRLQEDRTLGSASFSSVKMALPAANPSRRQRRVNRC